MNIFKALWRRKKLLFVLILLAVVLFLVVRRNSNGKTVRSATVDRGDVKETLLLSGSVEAGSKATLTFSTPGTLSTISVEEGDIVKKGQFLARLDTTSINADLQRARWDLHLARATVDRVHDDLKGKDSTETFEEKETRITAEVVHDKAYENYIKAQKALRDASLFAPIAGVISEVNVTAPGASVSITSPQFEIVDQDTIYFSVSADQTEVIDINPSDYVEITLDSYSDKPIPGVIGKVSLTPKSGVADTVYDVKISFDSLDRLPKGLRVGMSGDALFTLGSRNNVLYLDPAFIKTDEKGKYVLKGEKKEKVYIKTGLEGEERVEVTEGLSEGDKVFQN